MNKITRGICCYPLVNLRGEYFKDKGVHFESLSNSSKRSMKKRFRTKYKNKLGVAKYRKWREF